MEKQDPRLKSIWRQTETPVIYKQPRPQPILFKVPYARDNYDWVHGDKHHKPKWNSKFKCWETPISWFDELIEQALKRFGKIYVIQTYKELQKCAPACWNATGFHCECSCMGANHGSGDPGRTWQEVSDTFAFQWGPRQYACRLITVSS
jgi:hypothetical protein